MQKLWGSMLQIPRFACTNCSLLNTVQIKTFFLSFLYHFDLFNNISIFAGCYFLISLSISFLLFFCGSFKLQSVLGDVGLTSGSFIDCVAEIFHLYSTLSRNIPKSMTEIFIVCFPLSRTFSVPI